MLPQRSAMRPWIRRLVEGTHRCHRVRSSNLLGVFWVTRSREATIVYTEVSQRISAVADRDIIRISDNLWVDFSESS